MEFSLYLFALPCQKSAPNAVATGNRKVKKSFPHIYEMTFQRVSDQLLLLSLSLLLLTNTVLLVALETDKYTDINLCVYFNVYIHRENIGQETLMQPPLPMPCTFLIPPCSPGWFYHLLLCWCFYWDWIQREWAVFMLSTEVKVFSPFLQIDKFSSGWGCDILDF